MDAYTLHLLGMAVEATSGYLDISPRASGGWVAINSLSRTYAKGFGPTLADALHHLLTDLGVEVPERPSEWLVSTVNASTSDVSGTAWMKTALRDRYAHPPTRLAVLELLDGGPS